MTGNVIDKFCHLLASTKLEHSMDKVLVIVALAVGIAGGIYVYDNYISTG